MPSVLISICSVYCAVYSYMARFTIFINQLNEYHEWCWNIPFYNLPTQVPVIIFTVRLLKNFPSVSPRLTY